MRIKKQLSFESSVNWVPLLSLIMLGMASCTKGSSKSQPPNAAANATPLPMSPTTAPNAPGLGNVEAAPIQYALASLAGEDIFCQGFTTQQQIAQTDLEALINRMAGAQAGIPAELLNPFTVQTLALVIKAKACDKTPDLLKNGHCAVAVNRQVATGTVSVQSEQRLFWKDVPVLTQASSVKTSIDSKTAIVSAKNAVVMSLQKQITQQQMLLQILQATTGNSQLMKDAQALLASLQDQVKAVETEIKTLEEQIKPLQDELNKRIEELNTARAALKLACNASGMGAVSATWKEN